LKIFLPVRLRKSPDCIYLRLYYFEIDSEKKIK
jgi:hypothetical protein